MRIVQTSIHTQRCSTMMIYLQSSIPKTSLRIDPTQCQEQIRPAGTFVLGKWERATSVSLVKTTFTAPANTGPVWVSSWVPGFDELTSGWSCCLIAVIIMYHPISSWRIPGGSDGRHYHGQWSKNTLHGLGDMRLSGSWWQLRSIESNWEEDATTPPEMHTCKNPFALT